MEERRRWGCLCVLTVVVFLTTLALTWDLYSALPFVLSLLFLGLLAWELRQMVAS
jgi:hypothetical protein